MCFQIQSLKDNLIFRKMFIGGLSWQTTPGKILSRYFPTTCFAQLSFPQLSDKKWGIHFSDSFLIILKLKNPGLYAGCFDCGMIEVCDEGRAWHIQL